MPANTNLTSKHIRSKHSTRRQRPGSQPSVSRPFARHASKTTGRIPTSLTLRESALRPGASSSLPQWATTRRPRPSRAPPARRQPRPTTAPLYQRPARPRARSRVTTHLVTTAASLATSSLPTPATALSSRPRLRSLRPRAPPSLTGQRAYQPQPSPPSAAPLTEVASIRPRGPPLPLLPPPPSLAHLCAMNRPNRSTCLQNRPRSDRITRLKPLKSTPTSSPTAASPTCT
jgi:hypothetical protein